MGGSQGKTELSDSKVVELALASGVKVYAGFRATERRLVFVHGENFPNARRKLFTILPDGRLEGKEEDGKKLIHTIDKGIITYPFPQTIKKETVDQNAKIRNSGCVFQVDDSTFRLAQMWTVNFNDQFRKDFTVHETNPNTTEFDEEAVKTFVDALVELFGEGARNHSVKFCTKETQNIERTFVGSPSQIKTFLAHEGVKESLNISSVGSEGDPNQVVVKTLDNKGNRGSQTFTLGDQDTEQVLYKRKGFTSFMCVKALPQFEEDCVLHGQIQ